MAAVVETAALSVGCKSGDVSLGLVIVLSIVWLAVGFLMGTRARQIAASLQAVPKALQAFTFRIPSSDASVLGQQTNKDDGGEDQPEEEEEEDIAKSIENFIQSSDADPTLADHPDVHVSPIFTYKIKQMKEEQRAQQRRAALLAEGFDPSEVEERMQIEATSGSGGGGAGRQNPLALLVSVGARVEPTAGGSSQEHVQLQERKRMQRNVDAYLSKAEGIEKFRPEKAEYNTRDPISGTRYKAAHEVARETMVTPFGGSNYARNKTNVRVAHDARNTFRRWKRVNGAMIEFKNHGEETTDGADKGPTGLTRARGVNIASSTAGMNADMMAALQAEFDVDEEGEEDGEEGDEDEEGIDDDNNGLEA